MSRTVGAKIYDVGVAGSHLGLILNPRQLKYLQFQSTEFWIIITGVVLGCFDRWIGPTKLWRNAANCFVKNLDYRPNQRKPPHGSSLICFGPKKFEKWKKSASCVSFSFWQFFFLFREGLRSTKMLRLRWLLAKIWTSSGETKFRYHCNQASVNKNIVPYHAAVIIVRRPAVTAVTAVMKLL